LVLEAFSTIQKEVEMSRKWFVLLGCFSLMFLLVSCKSDANMPNPASVYCEENGGTLEIRKDEQGNEIGYCVFEDGSECEEWTFYRGDCKPGDSLTPGVGLPNPASVYCEENGGTVDIREDANGSQIGYCIFEDGSECEEWAFYRGECSSGE
jgi:putative hemolysin